MYLTGGNLAQSRSKDLRFGRSPVHAWGLFARDAIPREDFVMEYVGETIRSSLEDCKEAEYQRSGLGSSYLFRVDKDTVVDATKKVMLFPFPLSSLQQFLAQSSQGGEYICLWDFPQKCWFWHAKF